MQTVKKEIIAQIKYSNKVKAKLAYVFDKHIKTIEKWIDDDNVILTTPTATKAISEELNILESDILTEV